MSIYEFNEEIRGKIKEQLKKENAALEDIIKVLKSYGKVKEVSNKLEECKRYNEQSINCFERVFERINLEDELSCKKMEELTEKLSESHKIIEKAKDMFSEGNIIHKYADSDGNEPNDSSILENETINKVLWNTLNNITTILKMYMLTKDHYSNNAEVLGDMSGFVDPNTGYIEHQEDEAWKNVLIGYSNIYNSGCGAIATYNALVGLGDTTDMEDIIKWYEDDTGINVFGYFGVNPYKIDNYFEEHGYTTNQYNNVTKLPTEAQSDVVIVCHWNDEDDITSGAHFVALTKIIGENGKTYYAEHNNKSKSNKYSSLYEYYEQNKEYGFVSATEIYK